MAEEKKGGEENNKQQEGGAVGGAASGGSGEKTFTQAEVIAMATKEKDQGRRSVLQELGLSNEGDISKLRALLDSQKSDEEKKAEQDAATKALEAKAARAEAKAEAYSYDVKKDCVDEVVDLALIRMSNGNTDFKTAVGELKTKFPHMFNNAAAGDDDDDDKGGKKKEEEKKKKAGQTGTGGQVGAAGSSGGAGGEIGGIGARLAASRKGANKSDAPYWKKNK